jgi:hypothetical protein
MNPTFTTFELSPYISLSISVERGNRRGEVLLSEDVIILANFSHADVHRSGITSTMSNVLKVNVIYKRSHLPFK